MLKHLKNLLKEANTATGSGQAERLLETAAALYRGSYLLEELYAEWATPRRDALQRGWVGLLLNLANLRAERKAFVSAIETLDRLRTAEPTNETALQRLMILLTHLDRRGEALQVYRQHVAMLQREYESEPLPETIELYEALRQGQIPDAYTIKTPTSTTAEKEASTPTTSTSEEPAPPPPEVSFARPALQLGRHNQSPLIGRDREFETMRQVMLSVEGVQTPSPPGTNEETLETIYRSIQTSSSSSRLKRPHFLLLMGEPGIGKTRLAEELSIEAYTRGWAVAWSRSYEQERTIPYRPWTELLRTLLHGTSTFTDLVNNASSGDGSVSPTSSSFKLERLSALLPELVAHTTLPMRSSPTLLHEQDRLHLWEATLALFGALSKTHPLLLVLDDLHWTDDSSIELLTYLTHHLQDQRILLVATCRDGELAPQHKLRALIADLRREQAIVTLSIQPLTHSQIGTLVSHLPLDAVQSIQTRAAGNPFFAEELARYVGATSSKEDPLGPIALNERSRTPSRSKSEHKTVRSHRSLPEAIAAVLERRLSRLSSGCQTLLGKAAVLGGSFELSQLLPMANEHTEDTVLDLLEEALHAGLLTEEGTGAHITYHFWHPLIISHLYERLSAARRAQLHRRAAEAIKIANESSPQEKVAAAIVHHLSRGGSDPSQVVYYAELAGNYAYSLAAYSEAQQYYLQALQVFGDNERQIPEDTDDIHTLIQRITPKVSSNLPLTDPMHICRLLERIAECSMVQGNFDDARHLYQCILELRTSEIFQKYFSPSVAGSEEKQRQEAQIQALLWREIGNTWSSIGEYAQAYECYEHGKEVMYRTGVTTGTAWACLHLQYGEMLRLGGNYDEARRYLQEALEMLERVVPSQPTTLHHLETDTVGSMRKQDLSSLSLISSYEGVQGQSHKELQTRIERALIGDPLEIGYAHERLGIVAASIGQMSDGLQHMHTALNIYEQSELVTETARVCSNLGAVYIMKGEHVSARKYLYRSLDLAERTGDLPNMATVILNLGDVAHRSGNLLEAERWFKRSLALSERINDRENTSWCHVALAAVQQDMGKMREAGISIQRAISIGRAIKSPRCIRHALVGLGDLRIVEATTTYKLPSAGSEENSQVSTSYQRLLLRAKSTLQRAVSLDGLEAEHIIDGKELMATLSFLLGELETAQQIALQTLKEAQENETTRIVGRSYRLLGRIQAAQGNYELADQYFEQAIQIFRECELRLDYARTLHNYGLALLQRNTDKPANVIPITRDKTYQKGFDYLNEARAIFAECHAAIDLAWVERIFVKFETRNVGKR